MKIQRIEHVGVVVDDCDFKHKFAVSRNSRHQLAVSRTKPLQPGRI